MYKYDMPHFLNTQGSSVVNSEPSGDIEEACRRCGRRTQSLQMALKLPSKNVTCEVLASGGATVNLSLSNDG